MYGSASLDVEVFHMCDHADAGPAFRFHFVEVFKAGEVSSGIGSSGLSGLLADGVGGANVIDAGHLHGLGALVSIGEKGQQGQKGDDEH